MEIKDTKDIIYDNYKIHHTKLGKDIRPKKHDIKKWVAVDDVINYLKNNSFGYKDLGCNAIDGDELIKELQQNSVKRNRR